MLTSHGDYQNGPLSRPCQAVIGGEFLFSGEAGHGGDVHRRNALDATKAELARRTAAITLTPHALGAWRTIREDPARLWDGTWEE